MEQPTADEIQKVREWECSQSGHSVITATTAANIEPLRFFCSNCDRSWSPASRESESFLTTAMAVRFDAYTMGLEPWPGHPNGGEVHQWLKEREISHEMDQDRNGPAYLRIFTPNGALRVDVGNWIAVSQGRIVVLKEGRNEVAVHLDDE